MDRMQILTRSPLRNKSAVTRVKTMPEIRCSKSTYISAAGISQKTPNNRENMKNPHSMNVMVVEGNKIRRFLVLCQGGKLTRKANRI